MALLVLVNATVMNRFVDGPFWRHISDQNRLFSRENWWKNVFMINNFSQKNTVGDDDVLGYMYMKILIDDNYILFIFKMGPHTWYLAADLQLFAFYTIVLIVMAK